MYTPLGFSVCSCRALHFAKNSMETKMNGYDVFEDKIVRPTQVYFQFSNKIKTIDNDYINTHNTLVRIEMIRSMICPTMARTHTHI